jgi:hypothetical protein
MARISLINKASQIRKVKKSMGKARSSTPLKIKKGNEKKRDLRKNLFIHP